MAIRVLQIITTMATLDKQPLGYLNQEELMNEFVAWTRLSVSDVGIHTHKIQQVKCCSFPPLQCSMMKCVVAEKLVHSSHELVVLCFGCWLSNYFLSTLCMSRSSSCLNGAGIVKCGKVCHWSFVHPLDNLHSCYISFLDFTFPSDLVLLCRKFQNRDFSTIGKDEGCCSKCHSRGGAHDDEVLPITWTMASVNEWPSEERLSSFPINKIFLF